MITPTPSTFPGGVTETRPPEEAHAHAVLDDDGTPWRADADDDTSGGWRGQVRAVFDGVTETMRNNPMAAMGVALAVGFVIGRVRAARAGA